MPLVFEASMTMSWCFADESTPYSLATLTELLRSYAEVTALWLFEVANVLAMNERKKRITVQGSEEFLRNLAALDIRVERASLPTYGSVLLSLTRQHGLTVYDAAYLELAKRKGLPLATLDKDLLRAAPIKGVALVAQPSAPSSRIGSFSGCP